MLNRLLLIYVLFFGLASYNNCPAQQKSSPSKVYLRHYFDMYVPIQKDMWAFSVSVAHDKNVNSIEKKRIDLLNTLQKYKQIVKYSPNFENDSSLRLEVYHWMETTQIILTKDYEEIRDLKPSAQHSLESMKFYLNKKEQSGDKLQVSNERLDNESERFAKVYHLAIIEQETRIGHRLSKANDAFRYYDEIYLVFFEAYLQEAQFNNAVNSQDYMTVHKQLDVFNETTKNAISKLDAIKVYRDDTFLKYGAMNVLSSYEVTGSAYGKLVLEFYQTHSEFDKLKKIVMAKSAEERTEEEVNKYNSLAKKRNSLTPVFNAKTQSFNQSRRNELIEWNKAVEEFINHYAIH